MSITAGTRVTDGARTGVAVYDNTAVTDDTRKSVIVIFNDSTYNEYPRANLTTLSGGFIPGTGSGT